MSTGLKRLNTLTYANEGRGRCGAKEQPFNCVSRKPPPHKHSRLQRYCLDLITDDYTASLIVIVVYSEADGKMTITWATKIYAEFKTGRKDGVGPEHARIDEFATLLTNCWFTETEFRLLSIYIFTCNQNCFETCSNRFRVSGCK